MRIFYAILILLFLFSCSGRNKKTFESESFSVTGFNPAGNFNSGKDSTVSLELDYSGAMAGGFVIPTVRQTKSGKFLCTFLIRNKSGSPKNFYYKIFYQNETYKFSESDESGKYDPLASENFYGSYDDAKLGFKKSVLIPADNNFHEIQDSIQIRGNPRDEELYFESGINNRWKRNPRVGSYSFSLCVTTADKLNSIPDYVQDISVQKENSFVSPYYYFVYGEGKNSPDLLFIKSETTLKVIAHPDLGSGIYVDRKFYNDSIIAMSAKNGCGNDTALYDKAAFAQFYHYIDASTRMENIPLIKDVLKDNFSKRDYNWNRSFWRREELISITPVAAKFPCNTVYSDPDKKKIVIHNPKSTEGNWKKENVGIISRHGLTYGKVTVKAKLTELLNRNNVWNGITNAIWLISQNELPWNYRRACGKDGYMATYWGGPHDKRVNRTGYSEIDFEILKSPPYCPGQNFPPVYSNPVNNPHDISSWDTKLPEEILKDDSNISVACTNWDMACDDPVKFGVGCNDVTYGDKVFQAFRWENTYRALTEKFMDSDDNLFGSPYYYFQIEWKPSEIIWRIGPEKDRLYVVGYMNDKVTNIPNNQMLLIVTQEFHNTQWWPGVPYQQKYIPFPASDIFGEIYDVTIE